MIIPHQLSIFYITLRALYEAKKLNDNALYEKKPTTQQIMERRLELDDKLNYIRLSKADMTQLTLADSNKVKWYKVKCIVLVTLSPCEN